MIHIYDFIRRVKQKIYLPEGQVAITDTDIVDNTNDQLQTKAFITLSKMMQDYSTIREIIDLQDPITNADKFPLNIIPIPRRCFGNGIIEVKYIKDNMVYNMPFIESSDYDDWLQDQYRTPYAFFFISDALQLITRDKKPLQGKLEIFYTLEPQTVLYPIDALSPLCIPITTMLYDPITQVTTIQADISASNSTWNAYLPPSATPIYQFIDILSKKTGQPIYTNIPVTRPINTLDILQTLPNSTTKNIIDNISQFQLGGFPINYPYSADFYITPAGMTDRIPLSSLAENWLTTLVARQCLVNLGDLESYQQLDKEAIDEEKDMVAIMARRIQHESVKINSLNSLRDHIRI